MNQIAVLAKYPVSGEVKTRLSPSVPGPLAAHLHQAMVEDAVATAVAAGADRVVLLWAGAPAKGAPMTLPAGVVTDSQRGPDLGSRIAAAFDGLLRADSDRAVVIGTDCPDLAPEALRRSLAALAEADLVLGPARDGGYYLMGLRRPVPALFTGIDWGTDRVLEQTLARAQSEALSIHTLETLDDLDTPADLVRFVARRSMKSSAVGLRMEMALREMGLLPDLSA